MFIIKYKNINFIINMKKNTLELKDSIHQMVLECRNMVETAKKESRNMTEEEEARFEELKKDIEEKKRELKELEEELKNYEVPEDLGEDKERIRRRIKKLRSSRRFRRR